MERIFGNERKTARSGERRPISCAAGLPARYLRVKPMQHGFMKWPKSALEVASRRLELRSAWRLLKFFALATLSATGLEAQTISSAARPAGGSFHINPPAQYSTSNSTRGVTGLPGGPATLPYPQTSTPANDARLRNNAWTAYNESLHHIPTAPNPNRLAARQSGVDTNRFVEKPNSTRRYNFQFSDNEIRSVQAALRQRGTYSGQVDGILGPDTQRAIKDYQIKNQRPVTGQPDQWLNASLGIF
jgi:hypothetical protein